MSDESPVSSDLAPAFVDKEVSAAAEPSSGLLVAQIVSVVVGLVLVGWAIAGYSSASADADGQRDRASTRDVVLVAATDALEILNTMDKRDVDSGLDAWAGVSTGKLRKELTDLTAKQRKAFAAVAQISTASVPAIAVTRLDAESGTASVIAYVEKLVADSEAKVASASPTRIQFTADLRRQGDDWLVTQLTPVAVVTPEGGSK